MKYTLLCLSFLLVSFAVPDFKQTQKKYSKVRQAYKEKETDIHKHLQNKKLQIRELEIYIRIF